MSKVIYKDGDYEVQLDLDNDIYSKEPTVVVKLEYVPAGEADDEAIIRRMRGLSIERMPIKPPSPLSELFGSSLEKRIRKATKKIIKRIEIDRKQRAQDRAERARLMDAINSIPDIKDNGMERAKWLSKIKK